MLSQNGILNTSIINRNLYNLEKPFPHIVIDNFLQEDVAKNISDSFVKLKTIGFVHINENKKWSDRFNVPVEINSAFDYLNSTDFIKKLEGLTGINDLIADVEMYSGGAHVSERDGFLNIHADFINHPVHKKWRRRINVLIYFNKEWLPEWDGNLELWDSSMSLCCKKIIPIWNRALIFNTDEVSFHGHPDKMTCPEGIKRKSIAMYYYTLGDIAHGATNYKARPTDSLVKRFLIGLERKLLFIFHGLKSMLNLSDATVSKIVNFLMRK
jgi:hypothetical protein